MADPSGFLKHTHRETPARRPVPLRRVTSGYVEDVLALVREEGLIHLSMSSLDESQAVEGVKLLRVTDLPGVPIRVVWPKTSDNILLPLFVEAAVAYCAAAESSVLGPPAAREEAAARPAPEPAQERRAAPIGELSGSA